MSCFYVLATLHSPTRRQGLEAINAAVAGHRRLCSGSQPATEQEFREMFKATKKLSDKFGLGAIARLGNISPADGEANELLDGLRAALGEQRFQQFERERRSQHSASR